MLLFVTIDSLPMQPTQACSRDYGFDVDEEEIAREMLAPVRASLAAHETCQSGTDEADYAQLWFLS